MASPAKIKKLQLAVETQRKWIRDRGLTPEGYKAFYGNDFDQEPIRFGSGGLTIWASDVACLAEAIGELRKAQKGGPQYTPLDARMAIMVVLREAETLKRCYSKSLPPEHAK